MKHWLTIIIGSLAITVLSAQSFNYREVDLPQGIQASDIKLLYTDNNGFVWIAAKQYLYWHDGNGFREIEVNKEIAGNEFSSLYQDNAGKYWIGCINGEIYVLKNNGVEAYKPEEGTPAVAIINWAEDKNQQLWMCTNGEGAYVKASNGRWYNFNQDEGFLSNETYDIVPLNDGVAVATDQGLVYCTFKDGKKNIEVQNKSLGLSDQIVKDLHIDNTEMIAAFYEPFLNTLNFSQSVLDTIATPSSDAKKILRSSGIIWWLGENGKLFRKAERGSWVQFRPDQAGRSRIHTFTEDNEGHLWVLGSRGILVLDEWYSHISTSESVTAITNSPTAVWYAQKGDLYQYDLSTNSSQKAWTGSNLILSLYTDNWGNIWCGTFDGGLLRFNPETSIMESYNEQSGLANNNVLSIGGSKRAIWVGTLGGVSKISLDEGGKVKEVKSYDQAHGVSVQYIYSVHVRDNGDVYIGTDGEGVLKWSGDRFKPISGKSQDGVVLDVSSDARGNIWWVTSEGILEGWSVEEKLVAVPPYPEDPGKVAGIETLEDGSILVMHEGGVHRWIPETGKWAAYKKSFGLGTLQPQLNAHAISDGDLIYMGTSTGISSLSIKHLPLSTEPKTLIQGFRLFNKPTTKTQFSADENYFTFQYVGRWYTEASAVRYKLRLKGFDPDWTESKNAEVSYPKLPPGNYTFEVVAGVDGNYPEEEIKSISFTISQPWYARWYSIVLAVLVLAGLVFFFFRIRINTLRQKQEREKQQVQAQLETLKSQVNPHFLFNSFNTLMALIEEDKEEATDYLADLSDFFRYILEFREVDLISVKEDIRIVQTYLQLQEKRFGDSLVAKIDLNEEVLESFIPPLTLQLLVENAFKHNIISREKPLELEISHKGDTIVVSNRHWAKAQTDKSTGYGLDSIKKKYKFYNAGQVKVEASTGYFSVYLPVIHQNNN